MKKPAQISEDLPLEAHQKKEKTKTPRREGGCEGKGKNGDGLAMEGLGEERSRGCWDFWGGIGPPQDWATGPTEGGQVPS